MCYSDQTCAYKVHHQNHLSAGAASNNCAEARRVFGRDVVLGGTECSSPRSGKMSSTLQPQTTTAAAATSNKSPTTATDVGKLTHSVAVVTVHNTEYNPCTAAVSTASFDTVDSCSQESPVCQFLPSALAVSSSTNIRGTPILSPCGDDTGIAGHHVCSPDNVLSASTPLQSTDYRAPEAFFNKTHVEFSQSSILVPSVCWEQGSSAHVSPVKSSRAALYSLPPLPCGEARPPVLGEETRTGLGEDRLHHIMQGGDGWGECPAIESSVEGSSPEECGMRGSLDILSSGGSSSGSPVEWSLSLDRLLADPVGVKVYTKFLNDENGCSNSLDFFFACKGLGKQSPENLRQLLPLIWKKFIRNYSVPVTPKTHAALAEKIHKNCLSADMFRGAQKEVFDRMMDTTYPAFLQSQYYLEQLQQCHQEHKGVARTEDPLRGYQSAGYHMQTRLQDVFVDDVDYSDQLYLSKLSVGGHSSEQAGCSTEPNGSWSAGNMSCQGGLSTVYENEVSTAAAGVDDVASKNLSRTCHGGSGMTGPACRLPRTVRGDTDTSTGDGCAAVLPDAAVAAAGVCKKRLNLTSGALAATMGQRAGPLPKPCRSGLNPYHASYGRGHYCSRQDSEGQSISSGAHTDDTRSYTDSSLDGNGGRSSTKQNRKQRLIMKESLRLNEELKLKQQANLLSPKGTGCPEFVVPRTQRGVSPGSSIARHPVQFASILTQKLEAVQRDREAQERVQQAFKKIQESEGSADMYRREHAVNSLPPSLLITKIIQKIPLDDEDSGQAILDQHVSRVWQDSSSGSPAAYSPSTPPCYHATHPPYPGAPYPSATPRNTAPYNPSLAPYSHPLGNPVVVATGRQKGSGHPGKGKGCVQSFLQQQQKVDSSHHAGPLTTSKSWHQGRHREHKGPDVYSTFSSDSGNVADYCESRNVRRHHGSSMPKTRSVPECLVDTCAGGDRYPSTKGGRAGAADLTDSGVSVISDSRHSLLTSTNTSVKQRVETWLLDSSDSTKITSSCSSIRGNDPQHCGASVGHNRRSPGAVSVGGALSRGQQHSNTSNMGPEPGRRRHRGGNSGGDLCSRPAATPTAALPTSYHGGAPDSSAVGAAGAAGTTAVNGGSGAVNGGSGAVNDGSGAVNGGSGAVNGSNGTTSGGGGTNNGVNGANNGVSGTTNGGSGTTNGGNSANNGGSGGNSANNGGSGGNSDRNTSSSNGSTMRKRGSTKHGGGGSDSQSSCGRSSDSAESTTVVYSFCDDSVPFVIKIPARSITLKRFKQHLPKRGNYRFFFKKHCEEFGVIQEEMTEDEEILPIYEGRIFAQIRKAD